MKSTYVGNLILAFDRPKLDPRFRIFLGLKPKETAEDRKRKCKKIGCGCWVPPGGKKKSSDKSQKHGAQREFEEETGWYVPLGDLRRVGVLEGYSGDTESVSWRQAKLVWVVHIYETVIPDGSQSSYICGDGFSRVGWFHWKKLSGLTMLPGDLEWIQWMLRGRQLRIKKLFRGNTNEVLRTELIPEQFTAFRPYLRT